MRTPVASSSHPQISYSCYDASSRAGESFVADHVFLYQISGSVVLNDGEQEHSYTEGDFLFFRRNQLMKFVKHPPLHGEYRSLAVMLDQETLRNFSIETGYAAAPHSLHKGLVELEPNPLYLSYMNSLLPYGQLNKPINKQLLTLKLREAILILLQTKPELKDILFDFSEPGKIDLEAFMQKNFHFNVELKRFAYLTGRSLATFKRDFQKIFHISPSRWLLARRLQEAHFLMKEKGIAPSDAYLEVGFENLSHFSYAFKKMYGRAPSRV